MPDPGAELKRIVEELRAISAVLDATETPVLVRPDVPYKQVTEELVYWAIRVYVYSIFSQFREMLRSALHLYDADHVAAVFLCARAMWEMAAHCYYVKKHCLQHMDKKDWQATWDLMLGINQGSRHLREKQKKAAAGAAPNEAAVAEGLPEGPHIAKVMACFNEYFELGSTRATENYSFLSEFCHPNSFAFTNHLEVEEPKTGTSSAKVTFIRPGRAFCIQVMPDTLFACMPVLFSMDELLRRIGDHGLSKAAYEFGRISGPPEATAKK
jgi:hypothetical protein